MRSGAFVSSAVFALAATLPSYVLAQTGSVDMQVTIPFEFIVNNRPYPAGTYEVMRNSNDHQILQLLQNDGRYRTTMLVLTRLARQASVNGPKGLLVFDVLNGEHFLAEVWMPEVDGYQVSTTTQIHKHEFVEVVE